MLIEVHYGDDCVLLVNGNCRGIHLLDYIRSRCHLPSSTAIDLCLVNSGEPFHLSAFDSQLLSFEQADFPRHVQCILTRIDGIKGFYSKEEFHLFDYLDQGTYIPLSNNPKLINNEFLAKLKKATNSKYTTKFLCKAIKQQPIKRRRSLKSIAIAAAFLTSTHH